jgi:DNA sulfur modification protein DndC
VSFRIARDLSDHFIQKVAFAETRGKPLELHRPNQGLRWFMTTETTVAPPPPAYRTIPIFAFAQAPALAKLIGTPSWAMPATIEGKIARAEAVLENLLSQGNPIAVSFSAGKDSSTLLSLLLVAAARLKALGQRLPAIVVAHGDTMVENPEMARYAKAEMASVRAFSQRHGLNVAVEVARPHLTSQWSVRVIGGRALPTFPGTNRDCSISLKVEPMTRLRKAVLKKMKGATGQSGDAPASSEPVVLLGTRFEESAERARAMRERGESDTEIRRGQDDNGKTTGLYLSPIAFWETDDVWTYLGMARAGEIESYSTFEETFRIYSDAMATSCVIVAEDLARSMKSSRACGARTGCYVCTAVAADKSMENMLSYDARYGYMRGLNEFRNFLNNTRWDMSRRSWVGRTIKNGFIRIAADAYSPAMMEELLRYALTIDAQEREAAGRAGLNRPRFELVSIEQLFAIDAMWSLQAFHRPFHALKLYSDVQNGARFPVPLLAPFPKPAEMPQRFLWVGSDWDEGERLAYTGLRSCVHELVAMDSGGCMGQKALADGRSVLAMNTGSLLSFEMETAYFVLDEELPRLLAEHHDNPKSSPTQAYFYYASLGLMEVKAGMEGEIDTMLRRSNFKIREGLAGQLAPDQLQALLQRSVTAAEAGVAQAGAPAEAAVSIQTSLFAWFAA